MQTGSAQASASSSFGNKVLSEVSDESLIRSIGDGDNRALRMLYDRHRARIYRFVIRLVANESVAEGIVNEVFLEAWRRADSFEARSQVATWLLAIARFKAISACRRRSEAQLDEGAAADIEDPSDTPSTVMEKRERSDIVQKCLAKLNPRHRDVINLIYYQGRKIEEAAQFTGAPISTIKTRMHYARNHMAALLAEAGIDRAWMAI